MTPSIEELIRMNQKRKKVLFQAWLSQETSKEFREILRENNLNISASIEMIIQKYIEEYRKMKKEKKDDDSKRKRRSKS